MSKFKCKCGNVIGFNVVPSRYEADALRNQDFDALIGNISRNVANFIGSIVNGHRAEWLVQFYGSSFEISDEAVVHDIVTNHLTSRALAVHQCEQCGRVWIQSSPGANSYASYSPEDNWRGALESHSNDFIEYPKDQDVFMSRIIDVQQDHDVVKIIVEKGDKTVSALVFTGVEAFKQFDTVSVSLIRYLSEWKAKFPLRRFLLDTISQSFEPIVEVTALSLKIVDG